MLGADPIVGPDPAASAAPAAAPTPLSASGIATPLLVLSLRADAASGARRRRQKAWYKPAMRARNAWMSITGTTHTAMIVMAVSRPLDCVVQIDATRPHKNIHAAPKSSVERALFAPTVRNKHKPSQ